MRWKRKIFVRTCITGMVAALALGCSGAAKQVKLKKIRPFELFDDEAFTEVDQIPAYTDLFSLDLETRKKLRHEYENRNMEKTARRWFIEYLYKQFSLFGYSDTTEVPRTVLERKRGNCLSLALLTVAYTKELGFPHRFQEVMAPPAWDRKNGVMLVNKHVNVWVFDPVTDGVDLKVNRRFLNNGGSISVVDYFPFSKSYAGDILPENEVVSLFYSNQAAEAFVKKDYNRAYWLVKEAVKADRRSVSAWNILGLIYSHTGHKSAETVFHYALKLEPNSLSTINNLAIWLNRWGREDEAAAWKRRLARAKSDNPFFYFDRAEIAYDQGDFRTAVLLYRKAIRIDEFQHEFHFGLFKSYWRLGRHERAAQSLRKAIEVAEDEGTTNRYHSKLMRLNAK